MGEKITGITEMDFEALEEGYHIMKIEDASCEKDRGEGKVGWLYKVTAQVQGGANDGSKHWEHFPSQSKKNFGIRRLIGFLEKVGAMTPGKEYDSDMFETEGFERKFKSSVVNKLYGVEIKHVPSMRDKAKMMANSVRYFTVKEVQEKMKGTGEGRTVVETKVAPDTPAAKDNDGWT
jgi:hypothetical protein